MANSRTELDFATWPYPSFPQQVEAGPRRFKIPKKLKSGYKTLLEATEEDCTLGKVREIKCRWCHDSFKRWKDFKRHCNTSEVHPLKIKLCYDCGGYATSADALKRHKRLGGPYCNTTRCHWERGVDAARTRRRNTEEAHRTFIEGLDQRLRRVHRESFKSIIKRMTDNEDLEAELEYYPPDQSEEDLALSSEWCPPVRSEEDVALSSECCTLVDPEEDVAYF